MIGPPEISMREVGRLQVRPIERRALKLRPIEPRALKLRAREIDFGQDGEGENRASQIAAAGAEDKVAPLHLLRIVDVEALVDVEANQDEPNRME